jgi:hypothetical protein
MANLRFNDNPYHNLSQKIQEESVSSMFRDSSIYSYDDFKDGSSIGSKHLKSNCGTSNAGGKQNEHKLKEKRSIFRAFKSFYGKGLYLDPEASSKRFRYPSKNKLENFDLTHSVIF